MKIEIVTSALDIWMFIIALLNLLVMIVYTFFTYRIAYEKKTPQIAFNLYNLKDDIGHIGYKMVNSGRADAEVWCKVKVLAEDKIFSDNGFYGDKTPWVIQSSMEGKGHFSVGTFQDETGITLTDFIKELNNLPTIRIAIQIKYRTLGSNNWEKSPTQVYKYDFATDRFWLDV